MYTPLGLGQANPIGLDNAETDRIAHAQLTTGSAVPAAR